MLFLQFSTCFAGLGKPLCSVWGNTSSSSCFRDILRQEEKQAGMNVNIWDQALYSNKEGLFCLFCKDIIVIISSVYLLPQMVYLLNKMQSALFLSLPIPFLQLPCISVISADEQDEELSSNPSLPLPGCCSHLEDGLPREAGLPPQHPLAVITCESAGPI